MLLYHWYSTKQVGLTGPGFWWHVIFFPCEIDDAIHYINLGYGAQAPKIVIL